MLFLLRKLTVTRWLPVAWTILTIALLCLPGSSVPSGGFFGKIENFDKLVHMILFGGVTLFWGSYYHQHEPADPRWFKLTLSVSTATILLGVVLEYVQYYFIPLRSFDKGDILADLAGVVAAWGYLIISRRK
jgi:hypothetical protein